MKIFFVRHGDSQELDDVIILSDYGKTQIAESANVLKESGFNNDKVYLLTSPQPRAIGSAEIIREVLHPPEPITMDWLDCNVRGRISIRMGVGDFSDQTPTCEAIIIVSHQREIMNALRNYAEDFGQDFPDDVGEGSVHLVDTDVRTVMKLFEP